MAVADGSAVVTAQLAARNLRDVVVVAHSKGCLLYTSDAADDLPCVDLGGRRIIKKKNKNETFVTDFMSSIFNVYVYLQDMIAITSHCPE